MLDPHRKGEAIHDYSRQMMQALFRQPSAAFIHETKKTVGQIVDVILSDDETAHSLLNVAQHDYCTYTHSVNVGVYAVSLTKQLYAGSSGHDLRELGAAFFLHDLGKTRIDLSILNKPGPLDEAEAAQMRTHPRHTYDILSETGQATKECRVVALQHHEREDGRGYPLGLRGDAIHDYARICSIADVFDALTSQRPYKRQLSTFEALQVMREEMLGHFHKDLLQRFILLFAAKS